MKNSKLEDFKNELETTVLIKVVSSRGHDEFTETAGTAVARIQSECSNNGKWAYINGVQRNPNDINVTDILEAQDITLTNALVGG
ncbi:hypothetical protein H8D85_01105 [bacterium]|nr:hypothetical protein [bacterium]